MISLNHLDIDEIKKIYLFANTPFYLYKHLRKNVSIQRLSDNHNSEDLIVFFDKIAKTKDKEIDSVILCYALIIALSFKNYNEVRSFFINLNNYEIEWADDIKNIFFSMKKSIQYNDINAKYKIKAIYSDKALHSTASEQLKKIQPIITIKG